MYRMFRAELMNCPVEYNDNAERALTMKEAGGQASHHGVGVAVPLHKVTDHNRSKTMERNNTRSRVHRRSVLGKLGNSRLQGRLQ